MGFDVRKCYANKSGLDGLVTTCKFVCSNQGSRAEDKFSVGKLKVLVWFWLIDKT